MIRIFAKFGYCMVVALAIGSLPARATAGAVSVSGAVRDTQGTPQVGALVQLLGANSTVIASAFTDRHGRFVLPRIETGTYNVKAVGTAFLPALRQNLQVRTNTVINLTLTTLFEAAQWLPAQRRSTTEADDDWMWTLRSSANRPLLRMLEDGPLVVVTNSDGDKRPTLKARITTSSAANSFGDGGLHNAFEIQRSPEDSRQLILRADFSGGGSAAFESLLGYRQEMGTGRTMRTVVAVQDRPEIHGTPTQQGLSTMVVRSSESLKLTSHVDAEVGNEFQAVKLGHTAYQSHPFIGIEWNSGANTFSYRMATSRGMTRAADVDAGESVAPQISETDGFYRVEHGLHQQVGIEHNGKRVRAELIVFRDHMIDPVVSGGGKAVGADASSGDMLYDSSNGLMKVTGPDYTSNGVLGELKGKLDGDTWVAVAFADGDAVAVGKLGKEQSLQDALQSLQMRRVQMLSVALNGKVHSSGTYWRASYRWQPSDTVTSVTPFEGRMPGAFLSMYLRQPIRMPRVLPSGFDALIDVRNLLAEGYRPFVTSDGSTLYFAQAERSIQGGVSFTF